MPPVRRGPAAVTGLPASRQSHRSRLSLVFSHHDGPPTGDCGNV